MHIMGASVHLYQIYSFYYQEMWLGQVCTDANDDANGDTNNDDA